MAVTSKLDITHTVGASSQYNLNNTEDHRKATNIVLIYQHYRALSMFVLHIANMEETRWIG